MWEHGLIYSLIGLAAILGYFSMKYWGGLVYGISKHGRFTAFVTICSLVGFFVVLKQQELKYELAFQYLLGTQQVGTLEARYQIRQCKEFVEAKLDGRPVETQHTFKAGLIQIDTYNNWDFCARTFGMNYWNHDISINGQNGGRLLCDAYARDTYRSAHVQTWCDTVFAPEDQKV